MNDSTLPTIDITIDLKEFIISKKIRNRHVEYALGFNEMKLVLDKFLQINNFSGLEIRSIYHLLNNYYFMGNDL